MDNCSTHRGQKAANRFRDRSPIVILIHTPVHASLAQPGRNLFLDRSEKGPHAKRLLISAGTPTAPAFQSHYERSALHFDRTFTRRDLNALLAKIALKRLAPAA
jgi:hypothetical protein